MLLVFHRGPDWFTEFRKWRTIPFGPQGDGGTCEITEPWKRRCPKGPSGHRLGLISHLNLLQWIRGSNCHVWELSSCKMRQLSAGLLNSHVPWLSQVYVRVKAVLAAFYVIKSAGFGGFSCCKPIVCMVVSLLSFNTPGPFSVQIVFPILTLKMLHWPSLDLDLFSLSQW